MKKKNQWIAAALTFSLLSAGSAQAASEISTTDTATSSSSSSLIQPFGIYTGYTYLASSFNALQQNGTGIFSITATTYAKTTVTTIGAKIQLQQWSGSNWTSYSSETDQSGNNLTSYRASNTVYVPKDGKIYRAKITHYIKHNGIMEQAIEYTDSVLNN